MKHINQMTQGEFRALPYRNTGRELRGDSIVMLPSRRLHDSGYRCMDFVLVRKGKAVCRLSGCSDVLHIDGIAGFGYQWTTRYGKCPSLVPPVGWSIDCLAKSGLLHVFPSRDRVKGIVVDGMALSSFELFAEPKFGAIEEVAL